jgi:hypothetical protein
MEGEGTMNFKNGDVYVGKWAAGLQNGKGEMKYADGSCYTGMWQSGRHDGEGCMVYSNGDKFTGKWCQGHRNDAVGTMVYAVNTETDRVHVLRDTSGTTIPTDTPS